MLIRTFGFALDTQSNAVKLSDLFAALTANSGKKITGMAHPRMVFFDDSDATFTKGLVVTLKDQKTFCQLVDNQGKLVIKVTSIKDQLLDFNFFVINKNNGHGLYQYYFHSCAPGTFGSHLRNVYRNLSNSRRDKEIKVLEASGEHTAAKEKAIRSKYFKGLRFQILVHLNSIDKILKTFKRIKAFQYEVAAVAPIAPVGAPLLPYAKKVVEKVHFDSDSKVGDVATAIRDFIVAEKLSRGSVDVVEEYDDEDIPLSVKIANIPRPFGEEDFDSFTKKINNLDASKFASHGNMAMLIKKATQDYSAIFMKKIK
ncbi:MAG: hypothetical protein QM599_11035 [Pseudoxanthomonas sp.]